MDWVSVCNILEQILCEPDGEKGPVLKKVKLKRTLDWLYKEEQRIGERLAICLCIDLVSGGLKRDQVIPVLAALKPERAGVLNAFTVAVTNLGCRCSDTPDALLDSPYARVVNLRSFSSYYHEPSIPASFGDEPELKVLQQQLEAEGEEGYPMEAIDRIWAGSRPIVWVTRWTFLNGIREELRERAATELNDIMGLGYDGDDLKRSLYAVKYPPQFPITCKQPTTFDAVWDRPGYYLSYRRHETWGLTHACSGHAAPARTSAAAPERVHASFEAHLAFFRCFPLGTALRTEADLAALMDAAYQRLEEAMKLHSKTGKTI